MILEKRTMSGFFAKMYVTATVALLTALALATLVNETQIHRNLRKIDWLACTACLACSVVLFVAAAKKAKTVVLEAGTIQNLSNLRIGYLCTNYNWFCLLLHHPR